MSRRMIIIFWSFYGSLIGIYLALGGPWIGALAVAVALGALFYGAKKGMAQ